MAWLKAYIERTPGPPSRAPQRSPEPPQRSPEPSLGGTRTRSTDKDTANAISSPGPSCVGRRGGRPPPAWPSGRRPPPLRCLVEGRWHRSRHPRGIRRVRRASRRGPQRSPDSGQSRTDQLHTIQGQQRRHGAAGLTTGAAGQTPAGAVQPGVPIPRRAGPGSPAPPAGDPEDLPCPNCARPYDRAPLPAPMGWPAGSE
jgi:hypothetical protein